MGKQYYEIVYFVNELTDTYNSEDDNNLSPKNLFNVYKEWILLLKIIYKKRL